jgi:uncharacterized glyoxalase superfamily protein PhnB
LRGVCVNRVLKDEAGTSHRIRVNLVVRGACGIHVGKSLSEDVRGVNVFLTRAFSAVEEFRHEVQGVIMHARIRIGDGAIEMGDTQGRAEPMKTAFYLYVPDCDALYQQAVSAGAGPISPPADQSYGERVGSVQDAMGITWYIARPA